MLIIGALIFNLLMNLAKFQHGFLAARVRTAVVVSYGKPTFGQLSISFVSRLAI